jgi:hypothetical protein
LIISGVKHIENRSWTTNHRSWLAIHAGASPNKAGFDSARRQCDKIGIPFPDIEYPLGGVVGIVGLYGIIYINTDDEIEDDYNNYDKEWLGWWNRDNYGWILKNQKPSTFYPIKGRQGLWSMDKELLKFE